MYVDDDNKRTAVKPITVDSTARWFIDLICVAHYYIIYASVSVKCCCTCYVQDFSTLAVCLSHIRRTLTFTTDRVYKVALLCLSRGLSPVLHYKFSNTNILASSEIVITIILINTLDNTIVCLCFFDLRTCAQMQKNLHLKGNVAHTINCAIIRIRRLECL